MSAEFPIPRAAYVHVPFCRHRCGYCNFTLVAGRDDLIDDYLRAIELELQSLGEPREVDTLFFGGGTPTHLPPESLGRLIRAVRGWFPLAEGYEFSVEANPADTNREMVDLLAASGVNRLSLGGQSFDAAKLRTLERDHTGDRLRQAVELAKAKIASVSLDLIFGVPGENLEVWQADLAAALALEPDHVSTYGLTFERGTAFWSRLIEGELGRLDEELERAMYAAAIDRLTASGFEHYEVSNFARPGHRCRHNEVYWSGESYFAVGPGAARYVQGRREMNHRSTTTYLKRVLAGQSPVADSETLAPADRAREMLVFALRRLEGIERTAFAAKTGYQLDSLVGEPLSRMTALGLLEDDGNRLRMTREGLFVSDAIWPKFLNR
ncbi:MAG: radical SAM family heme chaperone HemW [Planctomycetia bacterium]|nr:radical SAM family heme chaperone HemW [Planctomycetia bacterium]